MPMARGGSKNHRIARHGFDDYELSWQVEVKYASSRILHHRTMSRFTNRAGAEKFAKRWNVPMPESTPRIGHVSSPVEIDRMDETIRALFKGGAFYNNGTITLAFHKSMRLRGVRIDGKSVAWNQINMLSIDAEQRIELEFEPR